jgi:putative transposase
MKKIRHGSHSAFSLKAHLVWITKYRFKVLSNEIGSKIREYIRQDCARLDIEIISGMVSKDHIHLFLSYPPDLSISNIVKQLKGRSSRLVQIEFPSLRKRYWGRHFWGIGYGAFSSGNVTDEMIIEYIEGHEEHQNGGEDDFKVDS